MKKGFTLVELLTCIIVLGIISAIVVPVVTRNINDGKENLYNSQIKKIEIAAEDWAYLNVDLLPDDGEMITVTILELKKAGLLPLDIRNPKSDKLIPNDMEVIITCKNNDYTFKVNEESGSSIDNEFNKNAPILILNGSAIEYVEFGGIYSDLGVKAKDKNGNIIDDINIMYQYNGTEIISLNTSEFRTYTIVYSASSLVDGINYTSSITRTLVVRDTTVPDLSVPGKEIVSLSSASSFNLLDGVNVTDNSGESINVTTTGFDASLGEKIVSYTACDSHNNCATKKRIIVVE